MRTLRFLLAVLLTTAFVSAFLLTAPAGARALLRSVELAGGSAAGTDIAQADAIALLGGRTARVHDAARLHLQTRLPLLVTGKGTGDSGYRAESQKMAEILRTQYGIAPRWLETEAIDTRENAVFSWCLLAPQGIRRLALVTDPDHMLRARAAFHAAGFQTIPAPAPFRTLPSLGWQDLLPTRQIQPMATHALLEWGGAAAMLWQGWGGAQMCASSSARIATKLHTPVRNSSQGPGRES